MRVSADDRARAASTWLRLALLALLLGSFALRLHELTRQDIWWDEARNIDVALRPFLQIATAPELDIQPPVYYWLLHGWSAPFAVVVGQPPALLAFFTRLLSVAAGVAGVALLMALGRRVGGVTAGALAVAIGAFSPFWLAESQEARMYTTGFALLTAAAVLFLDQLARRRNAEQTAGMTAPQTTKTLRSFAPSRKLFSHQRIFSKPSVIFVCFAAAALLTHYNAVFVLAAWFGWWGVWALLQPERWRQMSAVIVHGLLLALLAAPITPIALRQIPDYENPNIAIVSAADYLRLNAQAYLGGYAYDPALLGGFADVWLWGALAVAGIGLLVGGVKRGGWGLESGDWGIGRHGGQQKPSAGKDAPISNLQSLNLSISSSLLFILTWLLGGLALYYVAVLDRNAFNVRYASFVTPALYTLIAVGLAGFGRWRRPLPYLLLIGLLAGSVQAVRADLYDSRFDREHIAEVTAWLRENTAPGDIILVDQKYPFGFYYQPYTVADATLPPPEDDRPPAHYLFVDINTLDQRLTELAGTARRVFWVQWFESDTDPRHAVHFLLNKHGRHAGQQWFQGYSLDWWELTPPTDFELAPALTPLTLQFDQAVQVVERSLPAAPLRPGAPLPVALRWQRVPGGAVDRPLKARVALYDEAGNRLAQGDERLLNDRHRAPDQWSPEDRPLNVYSLNVPAELAPGRYSVRVLVYDAESLAPLTWIDAAGNPAGIEPEVGTVEVGG
jgi:mannosyltransferase